MRVVFILFLLIASIANGQIEVTGTFQDGDSVSFSVSEINSDQFPMIQFQFSAEDSSGYPYWNMDLSDLSISEDEDGVLIQSLKPVADSTAINIAIVLDQSGSMAHSLSDYLAHYKGDTLALQRDYIKGNLPTITSPLENAKQAVTGFLRHFEKDKDRAGLYAFDNTLNIQLPPSRAIPQLVDTIQTIQPGGSTAFYDAISSAIHDLKELDGINMVIALTDGADNASIITNEDVIELGREFEIPIHCIGLGDALIAPLQTISDSTSGYFAYTKNSTALDSIYTLLNRRIRSKYTLSYLSQNWSPRDSARVLSINGKEADLQFQNNRFPFQLSPTTIAMLKRRELIILTSILAGLLSLIAMTLLIRNRRKLKVVSVKVYTNHPKSIEVKLSLGKHKQAELLLLDINGNKIISSLITKSGRSTMPIPFVSPGKYNYILRSGKKQSKKVPVSVNG